MKNTSDKTEAQIIILRREIKDKLSIFKEKMELSFKKRTKSVTRTNKIIKTKKQ